MKQKASAIWILFNIKLFRFENNKSIIYAIMMTGEGGYVYK
jgi:hypothetical protein